MRLPVPAQGMAFLFPYPYFPPLAGCSPVLPVAADGDRPGRIEGLGKSAVLDHCPGKIRILHLDALQMYAAQSQSRQVETTQVPPLQEQQRQQDGRSITVSVMCLCTQLIQKGEQLPLQSCSLCVRATQARQNWGHDEPLLCLPHVFTRGSQ